VRAANGTFTTFDGPNDTYGTYPYAINGSGVITGYYETKSAAHGFVRTP
jgi:hypothetical protein